MIIEIVKFYAQWSANTCVNPQTVSDIMIDGTVRNVIDNSEPIIDALGNVLYICF